MFCYVPALHCATSPWPNSVSQTDCLVFLYVLLIKGLQVDLYPGVITLVLRKAFYGY